MKNRNKLLLKLAFPSRICSSLEQDVRHYVSIRLLGDKDTWTPRLPLHGVDIKRRIFRQTFWITRQVIEYWLSANIKCMTTIARRSCSQFTGKVKRHCTTSLVKRVRSPRRSCGLTRLVVGRRLVVAGLRSLVISRGLLRRSAWLNRAIHARIRRRSPVNTQ